MYSVGIEATIVKIALFHRNRDRVNSSSEDRSDDNRCAVKSVFIQFEIR